MFYNIIFLNQNHCFYFSLPILVNVNSSHLVHKLENSDSFNISTSFILPTSKSVAKSYGACMSGEKSFIFSFFFFWLIL